MSGENRQLSLHLAAQVVGPTFSVDGLQMCFRIVTYVLNQLRSYFRLEKFSVLFEGVFKVVEASKHESF